MPCAFKYEPLPYLKFADRPFKRYDFWKIYLHNINLNFILCHTLFSTVAVQRTTRKPVCEYPACPVGEQAAEDPYFLRWQGGGEKMAGLLFPWQAADPICIRSGQLSFPVSRRRTNFSLIRAEGHWPRSNSNIVDFLGEYEAICETALGRELWP
jgi:hypothetical protein